VNASAVLCTVERLEGRAREDTGDGATALGVRLGLGYIKGTVAEEVSKLVAERQRGGPFADLGDLAARTATRRGTLEQLAWSGACDRIAGSRREALWQLGIAAPGQVAGEGVQMALPIELSATPDLRPLERWQRLLADYSTSGVSANDHAMAALRPRLRASVLTTSAQLARMPHGCSVTVAGLVIARQRPGTAKGMMFLLFEDEWGVINLIVPKAVYESHRALARAEPLLLARGRLERHDGVTNVIVRELEPLERFLDTPIAEQGASVSRLPQADPPPLEADRDVEHEDAARMAASMRAVAPPVQSFASGRRR
jgi:error-prone DNA polymerase